MESNGKTVQNFQLQRTYAVRRAAKRDAARRVLAKRVTFPVRMKDTPSKKEKWTRVKGALFLLAAILFHGGIVYGMSAIAPTKLAIPKQEKVVFQVVDATKPAPVPKPDVPKEELGIAPEITAQEPVVEQVAEPVAKEIPRVKQNRSQPIAQADPLETESSEPVPQKQRAVIGITMSSTVKGGSGPVYAVGNTRMGATDRVQTDKKITKLSKGKTGGRAGAVESAPVVVPNRAAKFIPTVSSDFVRPTRLSTAQPPYPPELKTKGIEGNVVVLIVINETGQVQKVRVLKSSGYKEFDEAAKRAALKEMYRPAQRDGKPVEYNLKYTYRFRMKGA